MDNNTMQPTPRISRFKKILLSVLAISAITGGLIFGLQNNLFQGSTFQFTPSSSQNEISLNFNNDFVFKKQYFTTTYKTDSTLPKKNIVTLEIESNKVWEGLPITENISFNTIVIPKGNDPVNPNQLISLNETDKVIIDINTTNLDELKITHTFSEESITYIIPIELPQVNQVVPVRTPVPVINVSGAETNLNFPATYQFKKDIKESTTTKTVNDTTTKIKKTETIYTKTTPLNIILDDNQFKIQNLKTPYSSEININFITDNNGNAYPVTTERDINLINENGSSSIVWNKKCSELENGNCVLPATWEAELVLNTIINNPSEGVIYGNEKYIIPLTFTSSSIDQTPNGSNNNEVEQNNENNLSSIDATQQLLVFQSNSNNFTSLVTPTTIPSLINNNTSNQTLVNNTNGFTKLAISGRTPLFTKNNPFTIRLTSNNSQEFNIGRLSIITDEATLSNVAILNGTQTLNNNYGFALTAVPETGLRTDGFRIFSQGGQFNLKLNCTPTTCPIGELKLQFTANFSNEQTPIATQNYVIPLAITHNITPDPVQCGTGQPNAPACEDNEPATPALSSPLLLTPATGASEVALKPTLTWQKDDFSLNGYRVSISTNAEFPEGNNTQSHYIPTVNTTTYTLTTDLQANTKYYWKVISERTTAANSTNPNYTYPTFNFTTSPTRTTSEVDLFTLDFPTSGTLGSKLNLKVKYADDDFPFTYGQIIETKGNTAKILWFQCDEDTDNEDIQDVCERANINTDTLNGPKTVTYVWDTNKSNYKAGDYDIKVVAYTEDGKFKTQTKTITLKKSGSNSSSGSRATADCERYFLDMEANDPLCEEVSYLRQEGIFMGQDTSRGQVANLDANLLRSEYFAIASRLRGNVNSGINTNYLSQFRDLTPAQINDRNNGWWLQAVTSLQGIVRGYGDGTLRPTSSTTGFEIGKVAAEAKLRGFRNNDSKNPWYTDTANLYNSYGIRLNNFAATRGDAVEILFNTLLIEQGIVTNNR